MGGVRKSGEPIATPAPFLGPQAPAQAPKSALDLTPLTPPPKPDRYEGPAPVDPRVDAAVRAYEAHMKSALGTSAKGLATAAREHQGIPTTLNETQQRKASEAALNLMLDLPVSRLSPIVRNPVESLIAQHPNDDPSLRELGPRGAKAARDVFQKVTNDNEIAQMGLAAVAIAGVGFAEGSSGLRKLGLSPKLQQSLFDTGAVAELEGSWDRQFANPEAAMTVRREQQLGTAQMQTSLRTVAGGPAVGAFGLKAVDANIGVKLGRTTGTLRHGRDGAGGHRGSALDLGVSDRGRSIGVGVDVAGQGQAAGFRLTGRAPVAADTTVSAALKLNGAGQAAAAGAEVQHDLARGAVRLGVNHDVTKQTSEGQLTLDLRLDDKPASDHALSIDGKVDDKGAASVGLGYTLRF